MKLITIPLRDFALPVPRAGSIEAHSGYGRPEAVGREIHQRVQKKRAASDENYQAEVRVTGLFERGGFRFKVDGRMDGIFRDDPPKIEEIKSGFAVRDLALRLAAIPLEHPYCLQLMTYGYIYWCEHRVIPHLSIHLVSSRNNEYRDIELDLDLPVYEKWLDLRLDELVIEAQLAEKRAARRRKAAKKLVFPFNQPRPGQMELIRTIEQGMDEEMPMLIQAPTGLGKTAGVLFPVLKEALQRGQKVVYLTPKNSQHSVAEDAVARFQESGANIKSITITAKGKICFMNEPLCTPEYCEYARDYYSKVDKHKLRDILAKKKRLKARSFRELGKRYQVCPFELQFDGANEADIVICDYNYVFAPRSSSSRLGGVGFEQEGKPNLILDEVHNLPARAMDCYSPALSSTVLDQMREEIRAFSPQFRQEAEELLDNCISTISTCGGAGIVKPIRIEPPALPFLDQDARLRAFLSRYLESDAEILRRDVILRLCFLWSEFAAALEYAVDPDREEFFTTFHPHIQGGTVKITCCDASELIRNCYDDFRQIVGFSATLKPFEYYARLSGLDPRSVRTAEFQSPFPREHRKLLIIPQISTMYSRRGRYYGKIAEAVMRISELRPGNYFVFFPSFGFLEKVHELFRPPGGFTVLKQERNMTAEKIESVLEHLREMVTPTIIFAVQGGSFSEGVDYAGDMVIGAFVIGPPLPNYDLEREQMRVYYQRRYGAGFEYAYTIPAMARTVQAAGRVIRSAADRGLIVLMDGRFTESSYTKSMPADWIESDVSELISASILKDVSDFWAHFPRVTVETEP